MRSPHLFVPLLACSLLSSPRPASSQSQPAATRRSPVDATRWIVQFERRSFDLTTFRQAVLERQPESQIRALVATLEARARADQADFAEAVRAAGGRVRRSFWIIPAAAIELPPGRIDALREMPGIARIDRDELRLPTIKTATDARHHNADAVHTRGFKGRGACVAILDTGQNSQVRGVQPARPHVTYYRDGNLANGHRLVKNLKVGLLSANDTNGHGTAVASVAAGAGWTTPSADRGHAYDADIAGYAIADQANGAAFDSTIVMAWQKVACDVGPLDIAAANNSYEGSPNPVHAVQRALDAVAFHADLVITTPAGNRGTDVSRSQAAINAIAVGAADADKALLATSGRGQVARQVFPDLIAHGDKVLMAQSDKERSDYSGTGTSFAAPQVCGAAALLRAAARDRGMPISATQTKAILLAATEASPGSGPRQVSGVGCGYLRDDLALEIATDRTRFGTGTLTAARPRFRRRLPVDGGPSGRMYQVAIAWHRKNFRSASWSNLDLTIEDTNGRTIAFSRTSFNAEEFVRFRVPANVRASFTIQVVATTLAHRLETFAWASNCPTTDEEGPARYSIYHTGCKGSGGSGGCPKLKQDPKDVSFMPALRPKTTYTLLVECPCPLPVSGFTLFCQAQAAATVPAYLFFEDPTNGNRPMATPASTGTLSLTPTATQHTASFPSVTVPTDTFGTSRFYIAFTTPDPPNYVLADNGTGKNGHYFFRDATSTAWSFGGSGLFLAYNDIAWDWAVTCNPSQCPGGTIPVIDVDAVPMLGTVFSVGLEGHGIDPAFPVAVLLTGPVTRCQPLAAGGAPSCWLCAPLPGSILSPVVLRQGIKPKVPFAVPRVVQLVGARLQQQWAIFDAKANRLGLAFTGYGVGIIGSF